MPDTPADEAQNDTPAPDPAKRSTARVAAEAAEMASTALGITEHHSAQLTELGKRLDALPETVAAEVSKIAAKFQAWAETADKRLDDLSSRLAVATDAHEAHAERLEGLEMLDGSRARALDALIQRQTELGNAQEAMAKSMDGNLERLDASFESIHRYLSDQNPDGTAPTPRHAPGVYAKVSALMKAVDHIGREREHVSSKNGPQFMFRGVDDAMDAVGHAMRQVGLVMETRVLDKTYSHNEARNSSGNILLWTTCSLTVEYVFIDPVDGSRQTFQMVGEGRASDDKATSKAASMALKYGLFQALMIPVTGLDDADTESPQVSREPAQRQQSRQQQPAQPRAEDLSPEDRARNALTALRALPRYPIREQVARFNDIRKRIDGAGIGHVVVEDARLDTWVQSVAATLIRPPAESQEEQRSHHPDPYAPNHYGYGDHPAESGY